MFVLIYVVGLVVAAIIIIRPTMKCGMLCLNDLLIGIVTCLFSFAGIAFLWLLNKCEVIAAKHGNPIIWVRKKNE